MEAAVASRPPRAETGVKSRRSQRTRVPAGRLERLIRFGWLAGGIALGGITETARRIRTGSLDNSNPLLTSANAERIARQLSSMRGAAMKLGQLLSLEGDDLLPPQFAAVLTVLRSQADGMPASQLRGVIGRAYGRGWKKRFRRFDMEPIAAASIGQVHRAVAKDGRELAVKLQYPGVSRSISSDVDNLASALSMLGVLPGDVDFSAVLAETKQQLRIEADYGTEARQLRRYSELVADTDGVVVPNVHDDLSGDRVLAMDYIDGKPLADLFTQEEPQAERDRVGAQLYSLFFRELFEFRFMQTDPNPANYLILPDGRLGLLDFGAARPVPAAISDGYAEIFRAGMSSDRARLARVMGEIGFFTNGERADRIDALVDLFLIGCEPFRHRGRYCFASSDLPARARAVGFELTVGKGFYRPPPPETLFLHRKLGGTFLLCARLGARVNTRDLLSAHVA